MEHLKIKRARSLANAVARLIAGGAIDKSKYALNAAILTRVVERYALDLEFLKKRYGIPDRAAMSKIAGLMAYAIVKYKPLVPVSGRKINSKEFGVNEFLAIYYGLCVCGDLGNGNTNEGELGLVVANPYFEEWFKNFKFLLEERNYTAESLIIVFSTLGFALQNSHSVEG
jgi:hypothetical protein